MRAVIRFDHRDTGRSSVVDFDTHPYTIGAMARDCLAVLDGYDLASAHVAGASLGGMITQWLGVHAPHRVQGLTVMSSSSMGMTRAPWARALAGEPADLDDLPPPSPAHVEHLAAELPPGVESDVAQFRVFNSPVRPFDEDAVRAMLELARSRAAAALWPLVSSTGSAPRCDDPLSPPSLPGRRRGGNTPAGVGTDPRTADDLER